MNVLCTLFLAGPGQVQRKAVLSRNVDCSRRSRRVQSSHTSVIPRRVFARCTFFALNFRCPSLPQKWQVYAFASLGEKPNPWHATHTQRRLRCSALSSIFGLKAPAGSSLSQASHRCLLFLISQARQTRAFPWNMLALFGVAQVLQTWHSAHLRSPFRLGASEWCNCDLGNASFGRCLPQTSHGCSRALASHVRQTCAFPGNMSALCRLEQPLQTWHSSHLRLAFRFVVPQLCSCDSEKASFGSRRSQVEHLRRACSRW